MTEPAIADLAALRSQPADEAAAPAAPSPGLDDPTWWRDAVIYEIYVRSFADGNGDGTGDLAGVRDRLLDLRSLGVDAIWFTPWYVSPLADGGYDVADYRAIDPAFGTLEEAEESEREVAFEMALMELVEDDSRDARQFRVG